MAAKKVKEYYQIPVYAGIHEEELLADAAKNLSAMWAEGFTTVSYTHLQPIC